MGNCTFIGQDVSLAIAMEIIGGYPTDVHISLFHVRFDPSCALSRKEGILDPLLEIPVLPFGLSAACPQGLYGFDYACSHTLGSKGQSRVPALSLRCQASTVLRSEVTCGSAAGPP
eukprot:2501415-Amphidinium_carterae.1